MKGSFQKKKYLNIHVQIVHGTPTETLSANSYLTNGTEIH